MDWLTTRRLPVTTPLLVVGAGKDRICMTAAAKAFAARAPHADYVEIPEAEHEILMERNRHPREILVGVRRLHGKRKPRPLAAA